MTIMTGTVEDISYRQMSDNPKAPWAKIKMNGIEYAVWDDPRAFAAMPTVGQQVQIDDYHNTQKDSHAVNVFLDRNKTKPNPTCINILGAATTVQDVANAYPNPLDAPPDSAYPEASQPSPEPAPAYQEPAPSHYPGWDAGAVLRARTAAMIQAKEMRDNVVWNEDTEREANAITAWLLRDPKA